MLVEIEYTNIWIVDFLLITLKNWTLTNIGIRRSDSLLIYIWIHCKKNENKLKICFVNYLVIEKQDVCLIPHKQGTQRFIKKTSKQAVPCGIAKNVSISACNIEIALPKLLMKEKKCKKAIILPCLQFCLVCSHCSIILNSL